jgi:hypothetical protein
LPLRDSRRLLFNVAGRAENAHRPKATDQTQIGPLGDGPALAQFIPVTLTLPRAAWHAQALDAKGAATRPIPISTSDDSKLSTSFDVPALAYAITR